MVLSAARRAFLVGVVLTAAGCATWSRVDTATQQGPGGQYTIEAPLGWVRYNKAEDSILITRDGLLIQHIRVTRQLDQDYFRRTKLRLPQPVLPSDLAQMVIGELRADPALRNLAVVDTLPATVAGQDGFRVHFQYRNDRGTLFDRIVLGTAQGKYVITMVYHGLHGYYFERDLPVFDAVAKSFRLRPANGD